MRSEVESWCYQWREWLCAVTYRDGDAVQLARDAFMCEYPGVWLRCRL